MSNDKPKIEPKPFNGGYVPERKGYQPDKPAPATNGHQPVRQESAQPVNPPKTK